MMSKPAIHKTYKKSMYRKRAYIKIFIALLVLCVIFVGAYAFRKPILDLVIAFAVKHRLTNSTIANVPDGLHVGLCGAGSQLLVDPKRSEPCVVVVAGKNLFVVDAGNKSTQIIEGMGFGAGEVKAIFLTSTHSYRMNGLGQLLNWNWLLSGNPEPIPVFGPEGVEGVVAGLQQAYLLDSRYKIAQSATGNIQPSGFGGRSITLKISSRDERLALIKTPDLEVSAFPLDRFPADPSVGYIFRYKGRSVVITGDTTKSGLVATQAKDVDLLVHDALSPTLMAFYRDGAVQSGMVNVSDLFAKIATQHATPEDAAATARDANTTFLLLAGITPPLQLPGAEGIFLGNAPDIYSRPIKVGVDGDFVSMPANSTEISFKNILSRF